MQHLTDTVPKLLAFFIMQIAVHVVASEPVKLVPVSQLLPPVVSSSPDVASITLLTSVTLRIVVSSNQWND